MQTDTPSRALITALVSLAVVASAALMSGCSAKSDAQMTNDEPTVTAAYRNLDVIVSATGTVQPIRVVEIKSKASGQILKVPVETGDFVRTGDLLAQVDTITVGPQLRQAKANLDVARVKAEITKRQKLRADDLFKQGMISQDDYDQAILNYETAKANVITASTNLEQAQQGMDETLVRAPSDGTILTDSVEPGNIIASTNQVSGGTTLMTMADLRRVEVDVLVDETDLGKVKPGQEATVVADAYPGRQFHGVIQKIEPEASVQQSVTFFPVIVYIDNQEGLLRPGMNADVDIHVAKYHHVLAISNEALKSPRSAVMTAPLLGIDPDSVLAALAAARRSAPPRLAMANGAGSANPPMGERSEPGAREHGRGSMQHRPGDVNASGGPTTDPDQSIAVVFAERGQDIVPVAIRMGAQDWDYTQVLSGLDDSTRVILPPSAALAAQSAEMQARVKRWSGGVMGKK